MIASICVYTSVDVFCVQVVLCYVYLPLPMVVLCVPTFTFTRHCVVCTYIFPWLCPGSSMLGIPTFTHGCVVCTYL